MILAISMLLLGMVLGVVVLVLIALSQGPDG